MLQTHVNLLLVWMEARALLHKRAILVNAAHITPDMTAHKLVSQFWYYIIKTPLGALLWLSGCHWSIYRWLSREIKCFGVTCLAMRELPFGVNTAAQWLTTRPVKERVCMETSTDRPTDRLFLCAHITRKRCDRFRSLKHCWKALGTTTSGLCVKMRGHLHRWLWSPGKCANLRKKLK